ncbi:MAG: tetratricopeptide repeat protein [Gammaproteobacteria bacterium]|nr:tetratricopeptide repeat protein [Gammaproteobacteria bacterium]
MDTERTEEEQVAAIKDWFKKNGSAIVFGLALGLAAIGGYRFWQDYTIGQGQKASLSYSAFQNKLITADSARVFELGGQIVEQYPGTPYASLAALGMARMSVESNALEGAEIHLNWVINNSKQRGLVHTAALRLARVMAAQKKFEPALALVDSMTEAAYASLYSEVKGDILLAKGQHSQAREAYQQAIVTISANDQRRMVIDMKLNDLPQTNMN